MSKLDDENVIKELRALTGLKPTEIASVFKNLAYAYGIGNYYNDQTIHIPYFGTFKLRYEGDDEDRVANVTGFFTLHDDIKKDVGIIEDFKVTEDESLLQDLEAYKGIKRETRVALKRVSED